jgi:hypothetical protein
MDEAVGVRGKDCCAKQMTPPGPRGITRNLEAAFLKKPSSVLGEYVVPLFIVQIAFILQYRR